MKELLMMRDAVCDERSLLEFLEALSMDWTAHLRDAALSAAPLTSVTVAPSALWQSATIGDFLDAAVRTGDAQLDCDKVFERPANHWHRVATILYGGKRYE